MHLQRLVRVPILDRDSRIIGRAIEITGPLGRHAPPSPAHAEDALFDALVESDLDLVGGGEPVMLPWSNNLRLAQVQRVLTETAQTSGVDVVVPSPLFSDPDTGELLHLLREAGIGLWAAEVSSGEQATDVAWVADGFVVDVDTINPFVLEQILGVSEQTGRPVIARHIEDPDQWDELRELGIAATSASPALLGMLAGPVSVDADQVQAYRVISLLTDETTSVDELNDAVRTNVDLSLRILRLVNSASAGPRREISSVREAIVLVGRQRLREWVFLTTTQRLGAMAQESATTALVRARFCEALAPQLAPRHSEEAFLAGLLSGVADHLGADRRLLVDQLPLTPATRSLLESSTGPLAELIELSRSCESKAATGRSTAPHPQLSAYEVTCAYLDAMSWTARAMRGALPPTDTIEPGSRVGALMRRMQASVAPASAMSIAPVSSAPVISGPGEGLP
jgi:EAL and modified HD-GYP domain-containing signal transduction protein